MMKQLYYLVIFLVAICVICVTGLTGFSQSKRARGLFVNNQADAIHILILKKIDENKFAPVDPSRAFQKGEQIKIAFESNFDGFVYVINVTPGGKKRVLFPFNKESNRIIHGQRYELPNLNTFVFDEEKGTEIVQVIMSKDAIAFFDQAVKNSQGELGETASSVAAELSNSNSKTPKSGIVLENITSVLPQSGPGAIRQRGIILSPGKDKTTEGTYIAIPDKGGERSKDKEASRLKANEVAVFEIRLQHI
ncbi:MAG: DUF4384 domain-containing protein [Acidobacteria bacterium]|nr:DUF4384 domain-containing protein [Acidobacteriota bacterium]